VAILGMNTGLVQKWPISGNTAQRQRPRLLAGCRMLWLTASRRYFCLKSV
jgi:hypothetical protein